MATYQVGDRIRATWTSGTTQEMTVAAVGKRYASDSNGEQLWLTDPLVNVELLHRPLQVGGTVPALGDMHTFEDGTMLSDTEGYLHVKAGPDNWVVTDATVGYVGEYRSEEIFTENMTIERTPR